MRSTTRSSLVCLGGKYYTYPATCANCWHANTTKVWPTLKCQWIVTNMSYKGQETSFFLLSNAYHSLT
jgi:hypothetical protein